MRSKARETAFQYIYSTNFTGQNVNLLISLSNANELTKEDRSFCESLIKLVVENKSSLISSISENLQNFSWDRVFLADKLILLLGVAEMTYLTTPKKVCISEYGNIASKYSAENSPNFVNGILAKYYKEV